MSDSHDRQMEDDAPPAFAPSVRISASIEPEAHRMLISLCKQLYPGKRASTARALVLELAVRTLYRRVLGDTGALVE